jgi:hypothetical protein
VLAHFGALLVVRGPRLQMRSCVQPAGENRRRESAVRIGGELMAGGVKLGGRRVGGRWAWAGEQASGCGRAGERRSRGSVSVWRRLYTHTPTHPSTQQRVKEREAHRIISTPIKHTPGKSEVLHSLTAFIGVSMAPGATQLTRMSRSAYSRASVLRNDVQRPRGGRGGEVLVGRRAPVSVRQQVLQSHEPKCCTRSR